MFCPGKPGFVESYCEYVKLLVRSSGIDGLMCDDVSFAQPYASCGCAECLERFRQKSGMELPPVGDKSFWGNWENPVWNIFIDDHFEVVADFYRHVRAALPSADFPLTACCSACCSNDCASHGHDLRQQLAGCNIAHLELCGNTPACADDKSHGDFNSRLLDAAFHLGIAAEYNVPSLAVHYGFIPDNANAGWALIKALGGNSWFSTLPFRLGVSQQVLSTLGGDAAPAARAFNFEKNHPEFFSGTPLYKCSIYFSYETRNHSAFGSMVNGYCQDFSQTVTTLFAAGAMPRLITRMPDNGNGELLILPSAALMNDDEKRALEKFLASGGKVIAFGPCSWGRADGNWPVPMQCSDDITLSGREWGRIFGGKVAPVTGERCWRELSKNFFYHPGKLQDGDITVEELTAKVLEHSRKIPGVRQIEARGFFATAAQLAADRTLLFLTAMEYDVQIDHALEAIRNHRTRVNLFTQASPCGQQTDLKIILSDDWQLTGVTLPFEECGLLFDSSGHIKLSRPAVSVLAELTFKADKSDSPITEIMR